MFKRIILSVSQILDFLIDFAYPKECLVCGKEDCFICESCLKDFEYADQICPECGGESAMGWTHEQCRKKKGMDGLVSIYDYQDQNVRKLVDEIKFGFNRNLIKLVLEKCTFELGINLIFI